MMDFDKLPKGMKIPKPVIEPEEIEGTEDHTILTHAEVNYSKAIREALDNIEGLDVSVRLMTIEEVEDSDPVVTMELEVKSRG